MPQDNNFLLYKWIKNHLKLAFLVLTYPATGEV